MLFALCKSLDILFSIKLPYLGITSFVRTGRFLSLGLNLERFFSLITVNLKNLLPLI